MFRLTLTIGSGRNAARVIGGEGVFESVVLLARMIGCGVDASRKIGGEGGFERLLRMRRRYEITRCTE